MVVDNTFLYVDEFSLSGSCQKDNLVDMGYVVHHRQEEWQTCCFTSQFHLCLAVVRKIIWLIWDMLYITDRKSGKPAVLPLNSTWHFCRCCTLCKSLCIILKRLDPCHRGETFWSGCPIFSWVDTGLKATSNRRADLSVGKPYSSMPWFAMFTIIITLGGALVQWCMNGFCSCMQSS